MLATGLLLKSRLAVRLYRLGLTAYVASGSLSHVQHNWGDEARVHARGLEWAKQPTVVDGVINTQNQMHEESSEHSSSLR